MAAERSTIRPVEPRPVETEYEHDRTYRDVHYRPEVDFRGDRVYWGPIIAGFLTALTTMALLSLLGLAIGVTSLNAGQSATQGAPVGEAGMNSMLWAAFSGIVSFLLGGFITARTAATYDRGWGMLNGMMVFMLMLPVSFWFATVGLGAIAGGLGAFAGGMASGFGPSAADAARQAAPNINVPSSVDVAGAATVAAEGLRNSAWGALLGGILGLIAAGLGGFLGTRSGQVAYTTHTTER